MADNIQYGTTADKVSKDRYFDSVENLPSASEFGKGSAQVKTDLYLSDGSRWVSASGFAPSIYSATYSATTTVSGQSESIASGTLKLEAVNTDATNSLYIGFGKSNAEAELAASGGVAGVNRFLVLKKGRMLQPVGSYTHVAWLGVGGTVSAVMTMGV